MSPTSPSSAGLAVVTGASRGIGLELARCFAADGHDVLLVAEDEAVHAAKDAVAADHPDVHVHAYQADLATAPAVDGLVAEVDAREATLTAVALNAGVGVGGAFLDTDLAAELALLDLNVVSTVRLAKALLPRLVEQGAGKVLLTASVDAQMADPYEAVYGASKAFVKTFGESVAAELADTGVTVTTFMPGPTATDFFRRAGMQDTRAMSMSKDDPALVARQAYDAAKSGRRTVTTGGVMTHASNLANKFLPSIVKGAAHKVLSKPGTGSSGS